MGDSDVLFYFRRVPLLSLLEMYNWLFVCVILGLPTYYDVGLTTET
jgi:hypothetical protein